MSDNTAVSKPAPKMVTQPLSKVGTLQEAFDHPDFISRLTSSLPPNIITPERMLRVCVQAVQRTPMLAKVPVMQLIGGFLTCGLVGLEPNTHLQHAHLIPFQKWKNVNGTWVVERVDLQVIFGYPGLSTLVWRSGLVTSMHADVAWKGDEFSFEYGTNHHLRHRPTGAHDEEKESPAWAYMHASIKGGGDNFEVMPWADVLKIRNGSQGFQAALKARERARDGKLPPAWTEAPWVKHAVAMGRKTAFRAGQKWLPKSVEVAAAIHLDTMQDRRTANFADVVIDQDSFFHDGIRPLEDPDATAPDPRFTDRRGGGGPIVDHEDDGGSGAGGAGTGTAGGGSESTATDKKPAPDKKAPAPRREPAASTDTAPATGGGQDGPPPGHPAADDPPAGAHTAPDTGDEGPGQEEAAGEYFVADEHGEAVDGDDGYATSASEFVHKYRAAWEKSRNRLAMAENNADAIADALSHPDARAAFDAYDWQEKKAEEDKPKPETTGDGGGAFRWPLELPKKSGRPDLVAAVAMFRAELAKVPDAETLQVFITAHRETIGRLPGVTKANINTAINQRAGEVGLAMDDPDKAWLKDMLETDIPKMQSAGGIRAHLTSGAVGQRIDRIEREKPEIFAWFKGEVTAAIEKVSK